MQLPQVVPSPPTEGRNSGATQGGNPENIHRPPQPRRTLLNFLLPSQQTRYRRPSRPNSAGQVASENRFSASWPSPELGKQWHALRGRPEGPTSCRNRPVATFTPSSHGSFITVSSQASLKACSLVEMHGRGKQDLQRVKAQQDFHRMTFASLGKGTRTDKLKASCCNLYP